MGVVAGFGAGRRASFLAARDSHTGGAGGVTRRHLCLPSYRHERAFSPRTLGPQTRLPDYTLSVAFFHPFRPAYIEDPYPALHRLRAEEPVHWSRELEAWVLTRYEDCLRVLQDDDAFSSDPVNARGEFGRDVARKRAETPLGTAPIMGNTDPPDHSRLRTIVNRGFTPRVIEAMRPAIENTCDQLLDEWVPGEPFEVMSGYAEPLAISAVLEHLGVPREGWAMFREWSLALMRARAEGSEESAVIEAAGQARGQMLDYLARVAEIRDSEDDSGHPDVLSVLLEACDDETIEPDEMLMMLIHISLAGNGPTAMALGNAAWALAQQPDAQRFLLSNADRLPGAVEELLRFDSSTHFVVRFAQSTTKIGARSIQPGQQIHVMVAAANRDPERFPEPDTLDFSRADNRHLSFGYGVHFCLGAPLARLELSIAMKKLMERGTPFRPLNWQRGGTYQLRGLRSLRIETIAE